MTLLSNKIQHVQYLDKMKNNFTSICSYNAVMLFMLVESSR